ncbi:MAG: lysine--tRNA ligase [Mollicutes bacterium PWAP]|nr:lysine--tRNA ligase [Mollicutes bacterium PWAP]
MKRKFNELETLRREKVNTLEKLGVNAYGKNIEFSDNSKSLNKKYKNISKEDLADREEFASTVGRIISARGPFVITKDSFGTSQMYLAKKEFPEIYEIINILDLGDIVRYEGKVMKTGTGVVTLRVNKIEVLSKTLKSLPEKHHGLKDKEERFRRRYVDLLVNEETKKTFWKRTKIISEIRRYFDELGYMEAETPILQPILGGAAAKPFKTHHNALDMPFYMRIATELPLKRLLVGGIDRVYEIGRLFRNEGVDTTHNPEFTTIEFYESYSNLNGMINRTEKLLESLLKKLDLPKIIKYGEKEIDMSLPFAKLNMVDAVNKFIGIDIRNSTLEEAKNIAVKHGIKIEKYFKLGHIINSLFEEFIEETIVNPTFVYGHPVEISPLASLNEEDPRFTDRAELFIDGREYANMFTELHDPIDQLSRFESQFDERKSGNDEANEIDMDYVEALEYGMPPSGGCGIGIDRLVMLLTNKSSIREVLLFPHLKNKNKN